MNIYNNPVPRAAFRNDTGHGSGKYAAPALVEAYRQWLRGFVADVNAMWLDASTDPRTGELPADIRDLTAACTLSDHLCKFARQAGLIEAPESLKVDPTDRLVAVWFGRDRVAVEREAKSYCRGLWTEARRMARAVLPERTGARYRDSVRSA